MAVRAIWDSEVFRASLFDSLPEANFDPDVISHLEGLATSSGQGSVTATSGAVTSATGSSVGAGTATADGQATTAGTYVEVNANASGTSSAGVSLLINENFEGTGVPPSWIAYSGAPDFDYSASPISGSQSLRLTSPSTYYGDSTTYPTYPPDTDYGVVLNHPELWVRLQIRVDDMGTGGYATLDIYTDQEQGSNTTLIHTTGQLTLTQNGGTFGSGPLTADGMSLGVVYDLFVHIQTGDGGISDLSFVETGGVRPSSGNRYISTPSLLTPDLGLLRELWLSANYGAQIVLDNVQFSARGYPSNDGAKSAVVIAGSGSATGTTSVSSNSTVIAAASASSSGTSTVSANSGKTASSVGSSSSASTVTGNASSVAPSNASSSGTSTAASNSSAIVSGIGSSTGTGTVSGQAAARWNCVASTSGVGTATAQATNAASTGSDATATGSATVSGQSASITGIAVTSSGSSTVAAQSQAIIRVNVVASASGTSTVQALVVAMFPGVAESLGTSATIGLSVYFVAAVFNEIGVGVASAQALIVFFDYLIDLEHGYSPTQSSLQTVFASGSLAFLKTQSVLQNVRTD